MSPIKARRCSQGSPTLKSLDLYHTLISEQGHRKIKTSLPAAAFSGRKTPRFRPAGICNDARLLLLPFAADFCTPTAMPDWIRRLGGKVEQDSAGNIVAVNLSRRWVNDTEMLRSGIASEARAAGSLAHPDLRRRTAASSARAADSRSESPIRGADYRSRTERDQRLDEPEAAQRSRHPHRRPDPGDRG